jgi:tRNA pseudouridine38-40 synthase
VHALNQVVHFDTDAERAEEAWVRGGNRYLPGDIAIQWCRFVPDAFHSRASASAAATPTCCSSRGCGRRSRPGTSAGPSAASTATRCAAPRQALLGTHDFSAFRSAECQSPTPVKTLRAATVERRGDYWRFDFDGRRLPPPHDPEHHGRADRGRQRRARSGLAREVLAGRDRSLAAATFSPDGLYFLGPYYDAGHAIPERTPAMSWLP